MILAIRLCLVLSAAVPGLAMAQKNIATINGKPMTAAEYRAAAASLGDRPDMLLSNPNQKRRFLDDLINNSLLAATASSEKLDESQAYKDYLKVARNQILARLYTRAYLAKHMTEKDIESYFAKEKLKFSTKEAQVNHIIVKDKGEAEKALRELQKNPEKFTELLEKYAGKNPAGQKGGSMGFVGHGRLIENLEKAVFSTAKGTVHSQPVKTNFGYHVILVSDIRGSDDTKLPDVREKVIEDMEQSLRTDLIKKHRDQAGVVVDEHALKSVTFE